MKLPLPSLGILASLVLSACGSSGLGSSVATQAEDGSANTAAMNFSMPSSLRQSDDVTDNEDMRESDNTDSVTEVARGASGDKQDVVNEQDSHYLPVSALFLDAHMLRERLEFTQQQLAELDDVWEQVVSLCSAIADGSPCDIPAGTLTSDDDTESWDSYLYLSERHIEYTRNPDGTYHHSITFNDSMDIGDSTKEEYRWNNDKSRILTALTGSWQYEGIDGTFSSNFLYADNETGSEISFIEQSEDGESDHTLSMQLRELGGEKNDIEAQTQSSWSFENENGTSTSSVVANDEGGRLGSTSDFLEQDGSSHKIHSRHTFDADGEITVAEYCEESAGVDCANAENWQSVDESELAYETQISGTEIYEGDIGEFDIELNTNGTMSTVQYMELSEEEFAVLDEEFEFNVENAGLESFMYELPNQGTDGEFDWNTSYISDEFTFGFAPDDLAMDFLNACDEMGLDQSACAFGEVLTLQGTTFSVENLSDAFQNTCNDLGITEEDCSVLEAVE